MLLFTGARVTEILELSPNAFQFDRGVVTLRTLKRRQLSFREIPLPQQLLDGLDRQFGIRVRQRNPALTNERLWRFHRVTAWRIINTEFEKAGIYGVRATPRGLRHAFGIATLASGLPLNLVQKLLGHASIKTTTIYTEASGPEERAFMGRFWDCTRP
jgi:site-specific recombinase XerD